MSDTAPRRSLRTPRMDQSASAAPPASTQAGNREASGAPQPADAPLKIEGDALLDGSGSRNGENPDR